MALTSTLGILLAYKLRSSRHVTGVAYWLLLCIYIAKLALLVIPITTVVIPAFALATSITPPLVFYAAHAAPVVSEVAGKQPRSPDVVRISPGVGLLHAGLVVAAVAYSRLAIFDAVQWAFMF